MKKMSCKENIILFMVIFIVLILGIVWGLPSEKLNSLYFSTEIAREKVITSLQEYPVDESWKGWGGYLVQHPEEQGKKLPRNLYNPIRSYHPDEYAVIKIMSYMNPTKFDFNPRAYSIGGTYIYLLGGIIFFLAKTGVLVITKNLGYYFSHPDAMAKFYIVGRTLTALYGAGIILLTFLLLVRFTSKKWQSLLGGFFLLFTPLIILNSLYMYVDIPGVFWITACLYATVLFLEKFSFKRAFLAGIFAGLACGSKITFLVSFFIPFLGVFLSRQGFKKVIRGTCIVFAGFLTAFFVTNPYFFLTFPAPLVELEQHTEQVFNGIFYIKSLFYGMGMPLFLFCITGVLNAIILMKNKPNQRKVYILLLSWILFFFFFISIFSKTFARYILPVVPPLVLFGSIGWFGLYERACPLNKKFLSGVFIIVALWTFIYGMGYKMLFLKENIRTEAGIWIKENIPAGTSIGVTEIPWQFQMPPFDYYRYKVAVTGYNFEKLKKEKPDYFIISSFQAQIPPYPLKLQEERVVFWQKFRSSELYKEKKEFSKFPHFLGLTFQTEVLPEDLIYLNPTIVIFKKRK